jgi:hypothetical protein
MGTGPLWPYFQRFLSNCQERKQRSKQDTTLIADPNASRKSAAPKNQNLDLKLVWPRTIGVENAEALTGASYRWCRDFARQHGVPIFRHGRKLLIDATKFFEALERDSEQDQAPAAAAEPVDATQAVLNALGYQAVRK